jgi:2-polyprenyl-3-methyl-5-hydroxy-6-metoxy-1,4-benzoquinol methylase
MTNSEIIKFLTAKTTNAGFVDKLKIKYRPIICPFNDLIDYAAGKASVFDIGCGSGQFCALIAKFTPVKKIMGIEINERLVNNAKEVNAEFSQEREMTFKVFDGKVIPDEISEYDLVYMIDVFHHIPQDQQREFVFQLYKKMKKGAVLVFKDIDGGSPMVLFNKMHDMVFAGEIGKEMSFATAKTLMSEAGFTIKENYKKTVFVYAHYFVICEK